MNALTVKDLDMSIELDHESAASIYGGNPSLQAAR
jgi:hypothetical protein